MKLLKTLLSEDAAAGATTAGDMAGVREPLGGAAKKSKKDDKKKKKPLKNSLLRRMVEQDDPTFDVADVTTKLKAAEKAEEVTRDTVAFGLEDENGDIVKVYIRSEQAEDFEKALGEALADMENATTEIAEILFDLREKFDIVDVEWPAIAEDEEVADADSMGAEGEGEGEMDPGMEGDAEGDMAADEMGDEEGMGDEGMDDEADAKSAFQQVVDMMKAQAEAQRAEADAKKAAADAENSKYAAQAAEAKIRAEEEVLDMEAYNDAKAKQDKEAKKLQSLAKYRHDIKQDRRSKTAAMEEEEKDLTDNEMDPEEYLDYVNKHLRSQS